MSRPLIRVFGMRRSGNHAVIDWLRANLQGPSVFLNDCAPGDPFDSFELLETPEGERHGPQFRGTRWFPQFPAARADRWHVASYEDRTPAGTPVAGWPATRDLVVTRAFPNWLASYLALVADRQGGTRWGVDHPSLIPPAFDIWAALTVLPGALRFDDWLTDPATGAAALARLGLAQTRDRPAAPNGYGGGSSFDAAPDPDGLRDRWRLMAHRADYRALCAAALDRPAVAAAIARHWPQDTARLRRMAVAPPMPYIHPDRRATA